MAEIKVIETSGLTSWGTQEEGRVREVVADRMRQPWYPQLLDKFNVALAHATKERGDRQQKILNEGVVSPSLYETMSGAVMLVAACGGSANPEKSLMAVIFGVNDCVGVQGWSEVGLKEETLRTSVRYQDFGDQHEWHGLDLDENERMWHLAGLAIGVLTTDRGDEMAKLVGGLQGDKAEEVAKRVNYLLDNGGEEALRSSDCRADVGVRFGMRSGEGGKNNVVLFKPTQ